MSGPALLAGGAGGGAAIMSGLAVAGAIANNNAIKQAQGRAIYASGKQMQQVNEQAAIERYKRNTEAQETESRLRAAAGESGIATTEYNSSTQRANDVRAAIDASIINRNTMNAMLGIQSQTTSNLWELQNKRKNVWVEGLTMGLSGAASGLSIANNANTLSKEK